MSGPSTCDSRHAAAAASPTGVGGVIGIAVAPGDSFLQSTQAVLDSALDRGPSVTDTFFEPTQSLLDVTPSGIPLGAASIDALVDQSFEGGFSRAERVQERARALNVTVQGICKDPRVV